MDTLSEIELNELEDDSSEQDKSSNENAQQGKCRRYEFRMRHFFYIHLIIFIIIGLVSGLIIYLIENYSGLKNEIIEVSYINAWFVCCTCICGCGLTTLNFAKLSKASQIILLVITFFFGITISTLPALAIKAYAQKATNGVILANDDEKEIRNAKNDHENSTASINSRSLPSELERKIDLLPTPQQIRYRAYITIIISILVTCVCMYLCFFIILGAWLDARYTKNQLVEGNTTISPWYTSIIIVITGFNQNGLTPFSNSMGYFVNDAYMNIFVIMVVMSGASLFPFLFRNLILLARRLAPWRHKIVFDYIVLNHHHLSTLLYPTLQTRIYLCVTFGFYLLVVSMSLILDMQNSYLSQYTPGNRFLIFVFHSINARFAGFQTIDISHFAYATLMVYLLLMITKPQMLCALSKSRFEMTWISLRENQKKQVVEQPTSLLQTSVDDVSALRRRTSSVVSNQAFAERHVNHFLNRQHLATKNQIRKARESEDNEQNHRHVSYLHCRLFLLKFVQAIVKHTIYFLGRPRIWLSFFFFLICAIEQKRIVADPNVTVFKIVFELVSAFGTVGLTLGYPGVSSSFSTVLSPTSRVIVGITMLMGRHRGLLASMKDQEEIEHGAKDLLQKWKEKTIDQYEKSVKKDKELVTRF